MFINKIKQRHHATGSVLCVGLDPNVEYINQRLGIADVSDYNRQVVDATHPYALCYKPQIAHYSALGLEQALTQTIAYIQQTYPDIPVILDAKRGDIGSTADHYVTEAFDRYHADAVTVNPYLGADSITPFMQYNKGSKGVVVLAKTSNASADMPQALVVNSDENSSSDDTSNPLPLYVKLAQYFDALYADNANLLFVVGATDTQALSNMRKACPDRWFLVPGVGSQGGTMQGVLTAAQDKVIVNVTRGILYPSDIEADYFAQIASIAKEFYEQGKTD